MRSRLIACGAAAALLAVAGCSDRQADATALPPVRVVQVPAASAGGACILWDYAFIEQKIGVAFSVAASDQLQTVRFTFAKQAPGDAVDKLSTRLLDLAQAMDTTAG